MKESPTGLETDAGSNPAGVAAQTTPEESPKPPRTELRSGDLPKDPQAPRRPARGDLVEFDATPTTVALPRQWRPGRLSFVEEVKDRPGNFVVYGWFVPEHGQAVGDLECRGPGGWRWPQCEIPYHGDLVNGRCETCEPDDGSSTLRASPTWPVQRCTAPADGEVCGAVIGRDLHCNVCSGERCYAHCRGVDHYKGKLVLSSGGDLVLTWKICEIAAHRFMGQIYERTSHGSTEILMTAEAAREDAVLAQLEQKLAGYGKAAPVPAEAPRRLNAGLFDILAASEGKLPPAKRSELVLEVLAWLREGEESWDAEVYAQEYTTIDGVLLAAKKWHDRRVAGLFARLAGAL